MYKRILVALDNTPSDRTLLSHIRELARLLGARILLLHVAEGFAARHFHQLTLTESDEMKQDQAYLERVGSEMIAAGLTVETRLALGNPPDQIIQAAEEWNCDLIAMATHGHRFLADLFMGSTIEPVRHRTTRTVLLVRATEE